MDPSTDNINMGRQTKLSMGKLEIFSSIFLICVLDAQKNHLIESGFFEYQHYIFWLKKIRKLISSYELL